MSRRPIGIGILGAANIAERAMVTPAADLDDVSVVAIGSRDPERARALADDLGVRDSGDYDSVLANPDVDLVYVALPPTFHEAWSVKALEAGKHVLCEKPLSANGASAAAIAAAAARTGRRAFVGFHYRLHPFIQRLLDVLESGMLGELEQVDIDFSIPHFVVKPGNIRLDGGLGGGAFMDVGCYAVDLLRAREDDIVVESAVAQLYDGDARVDLQTDATLRLGGRVPARVRASFVGDDQGSMIATFAGTSARLTATSVIVPQWGGELRVTAGDELLLDEKADVTENSYAHQLAHLVDVLRSDSPSILDAHRAVGTMELVDAVYRAAGLEPR